MRRTSKRIALSTTAVAALIGATLVTSPGAYAEESPGTEGRLGAASDRLSDGSDRRIERLDQQQTSWESEFALLAQHYRDTYPETFAEARVDTGKPSGAIAFTGDVPNTSESRAGALSGVRLEGGRLITERGIDEASAQLWDQAVASLGPTFEPTTYYSSNDNALHVEIVAAERGSVDPASGNAAANELAADIASQRRTMPLEVVVDYVEEPVEETAEAWLAGHALYYGGGYICSTAFPVKKTNGAELGILTAGHCPGTAAYFSPSNYMFSVAPYSLATTDVYPGGDFRWLWSSQMFSGQTHVNNGDLRTFRSAAIAPFNAGACKFGNTTGYGCGTVTISGVYSNATVMPEDGGGTYRVGPLRGVGAHITSGGDSGGPWFMNSVGYGVHHGTTPSGGSVWSHLTNALTRFDLQLWAG